MQWTPKSPEPVTLEILARDAQTGLSSVLQPKMVACFCNATSQCLYNQTRRVGHSSMEVRGGCFLCRGGKGTERWTVYGRATESSVKKQNFLNARHSAVCVLRLFCLVRNTYLSPSWGAQYRAPNGVGKSLLPSRGPHRPPRQLPCAVLGSGQKLSAMAICTLSDQNNTPW